MADELSLIKTKEHYSTRGVQFMAVETITLLAGILYGFFPHHHALSRERLSSFNSHRNLAFIGQVCCSWL
jgi:hypothetical protein